MKRGLKNVPRVGRFINPLEFTGNSFSACPLRANSTELATFKCLLRIRGEENRLSTEESIFPWRPVCLYSFHRSEQRHFPPLFLPFSRVFDVSSNARARRMEMAARIDGNGVQRIKDTTRASLRQTNYPNKESESFPEHEILNLL